VVITTWAQSPAGQTGVWRPRQLTGGFQP
jgi:hypothetical protein